MSEQSPVAKRPGLSASAWCRASATVLCVAALAFPARGHADAVTDWNQELETLIDISSANLVDGPPEVAREMAIVTASMFDAVNAASGLPYQSYAYTGPAVSGASLNAAALSAGYQAVQGIFTDTAWQANASATATAASVLSQATLFYDSELTSLGLNPATLAATCASPSSSLQSACTGIALGSTTAGAMLAKTANDGSQQAILNGLTTYTPPGSGTVPGVYVPPATRPAMFPQWGTIAPMGITSAAVTAATTSVPGPLAVDSAAYANALLETECEGSGQPLATLPTAVQTACAAAGYKQETTAQAAAALFWNDPGQTNTPPGHWLGIANTVIQSQNLNTLQAARLSMLVAMADDDAGIASWEIKYQDNLWRPITAIQDCPAGQTSGPVTWNSSFASCDSTWSSLIATPPHPDYIAGHPAFSGAAATVLASFFGTDDISFSSTSQTYCNVGTPLRGAAQQVAGSPFTEQPIEACTVTGAQPFNVNGQPAIYTMPSSDPSVTAAQQEAAVCGAVGGTYSGVGTPTCTINGIAYVWSTIQPSCNDIVSVQGDNDSPLICPIVETFASFTDASSGVNGAEYSRIAGGIHTPFAVADALTVGNEIGAAVADAAGLPEPPAALLLAAAILGLAGARRRASTMARARKARGPVRGPASRKNVAFRAGRKTFDTGDALLFG